MKLAKGLSLLLLVIMTCGISYGLTKGNFFGEGAELLDLLWGRLTLVDFYAGIALFAGWVVYRERSWWKSLLWIVLLIGLGNWTTSLYVYLALQGSGGDWKRFWFGRRAAMT